MPRNHSRDVATTDENNHPGTGIKRNPKLGRKSTTTESDNPLHQANKSPPAAIYRLQPQVEATTSKRIANQATRSTRLPLTARLTRHHQLPVKRGKENSSLCVALEKMMRRRIFRPVEPCCCPERGELGKLRISWAVVRRCRCRLHGCCSVRPVDL